MCFSFVFTCWSLVEAKYSSLLKVDKYFLRIWEYLVKSNSCGKSLFCKIKPFYERISLKFNLVPNLMPPNDLVVREIKSLRKICNPLSPLSVFIYVLWENPRIFFHQNKFWKYSIIGNESQNNYFAKVFLAWFWDDKKKTPLFYVLQNRGKFLKPKVDFFYLYDTVYFNIFIQDYIYNDTLKRFEKKRFI